MFCPKCGKQHDDSARFCGACGTPFPGVAPVNPAPQAPVSFEAMLKQNLKFVMLGVGVLALILSIVHLFGLFDVTASVSYGGESQSTSGPVAEVLESGEFPMILIGNLLFGLANLVIGALGVLYFLKANNNMDLYDKIYTKNIKLPPVFFVGVVGGIAALVQILCYMISTKKMFGATMSFAAHWTTWVMLFVFAGLAVLDKMVLNKKAPAAPVNPTM